MSSFACFILQGAVTVLMITGGFLLFGLCFYLALER